MIAQEICLFSSKRFGEEGNPFSSTPKPNAKIQRLYNRSSEAASSDNPAFLPAWTFFSSVFGSKYLLWNLGSGALGFEKHQHDIAVLLYYSLYFMFYILHMLFGCVEFLFVVSEAVGTFEIFFTGILFFFYSLLI